METRSKRGGSNPAPTPREAGTSNAPGTSGGPAPVAPTLPMAGNPATVNIATAVENTTPGLRPGREEESDSSATSSDTEDLEKTSTQGTPLYERAEVRSLLQYNAALTDAAREIRLESAAMGDRYENLAKEIREMKNRAEANNRRLEEVIREGEKGARLLSAKMGIPLPARPAGNKGKEVEGRSVAQEPPVELSGPARQPPERPPPLHPGPVPDRGTKPPGMGRWRSEVPLET